MDEPPLVRFQYQSLPLEYGSNSNVGLFSAPAKWAMLLLQVTMMSQAFIIEASESISLKRSISSILKIFKSELTKLLVSECES